MSRPCAQCRQPLGELELSLKCANPRCTSLCHSSCASGPLLLNDGGRVPRWRCSECQLVSPPQGSGYESVYGRPRAGDTLNRIKDDWGKNRTIDALNLRDRDRGHFDRASNYRASTGAILGRNSRPTDLKFTLPVRPKSAVLTPTPTEDDIEPQNDTAEPRKDNMEPKKETILPKTTTNHPHDNPVPVRLVTPDEKYDETVKSFYKWLEEHECASKDKGVNRGGLVRDKIAQFGAKLEDHLASRNADNGQDIGRVKVQHPVPKSSARWGADSHSTWPKNQAAKQPVTDQNMAKSNDPMGERYYSGKLIEAEKGNRQLGGMNINQPVQSSFSKQMPIRPNVLYPASKPSIKLQDDDYGTIYANQQEMDNISASVRDKTPVTGIQREAPNQKPYSSPIKKPVYNYGNFTSSEYPESKPNSKQHEGNYATYPYQKESIMTDVSNLEKPAVLGTQRDVNHKSFGTPMTVTHPVQPNIPKQTPIRSNLEYLSPKPSFKKYGGDYGALYENPQEIGNIDKGREKSPVGAVGKPTVGGNLDGYNKGRLIDDERVYHNTSPIVQRGTQVMEVSSLKPLFGTPKSSSTRKVEVSDDEVSQEEDDFPPPPPCLETDLDQLEIQPGIEVKSAESAAVSTGDAMVGHKSFNDPAVVGNSDAGDDRRGLSVGQEILEDARIVQRTSVPNRGTFTLNIVNTNHEGQGVLVREVDEGQPCLICEKCQGFEAHHWRKTCNSCKCPRESHDVFHEEWVNVRERLGIGQDQDKWGSRDRVISQGLAWAPPGLPPYKVDQYFKCLPQDKVPKLGTSGEKYREKQLMIQLPKQDLALAYCRHVDPSNHTSYDDFITARNEIALDIAYAKECTARTDCPECGRSVNPGEVGVLAPKFGEKILWHPACFICSHCKQLLVDLTYCVHDDYLYCERHYAEQLKPRCSACDELIFSGEYTKAMSKDWHSGHFCCWQCDESLTGQRYVLRDDHPYCIKCYESVFANTCDECNKTIGIDSKDLSYKDKHWHEACFFCNKCRVSLVDKQFGSKADKIYCGNCYDAQFASRCDGCGQIFRAGTKKMEYKTRQWHEQCFCCCVCKSAIGTKSFIPREQEIYCATCYEEKFATRCVKCNKIITSGGVTYKNEPWHRECFTCTNCNTSLAGQRFTSRDEKPYCADCFGELFAKRCTSCCKPITGIGGTRFISFEDRHWHNDCFICASCKTSLVGRGFITDADDILCTECAKQKLM